MSRADIIFGFLLMATVMEGVIVTSPEASQYVPGVVLFFLPALNAGIAVWLKQMVPFLSTREVAEPRLPEPVAPVVADLAK